MATKADKEKKRFDRMLAKAKEFRPFIYLRRFVAPDFQKMIRAEAGADADPVVAVVDGSVQEVQSAIGKCVCVTCGKVLPWSSDTKSGIEGMDAGHFLASRRASILLDEVNVHPQCQYDNKHMAGRPEAYQRYMLAVYGQEEIDRLHHLKDNVSQQFTIDELVSMRIAYKDRIAAAIELMK